VVTLVSSLPFLVNLQELLDPYLQPHSTERPVRRQIVTPS
jgi:hypothetical protein